jgi:SAM-dependent methyltransferase
LLTQLDPLLPRAGSAIDVAGGVGRNSLWLANRGLEVTLVDISDVALDTARQRAALANLSLQFLRIDLEREPFPGGPWDVVLIVHYLWRPLFRQISDALTTGGVLVCIQPTMSNLQRHPKPSARFLLEDGELPSLVPELSPVYYQEGWLTEGRHEAVLVAQCRNQSKGRTTICNR